MGPLSDAGTVWVARNLFSIRNLVFRSVYINICIRYMYLDRNLSKYDNINSDKDKAWSNNVIIILIIRVQLSRIDLSHCLDNTRRSWCNNIRVIYPGA